MPGHGAHLRGAISISPSIEYMERAYDDAKYGNFSRRPYIDMVIPSLTDPSVAPPASTCFPASSNTRPTNSPRHLGRPARSLRRHRRRHHRRARAQHQRIIVGRQVLTPLDLESEFGLTQGNIFQGELSLEQLFFLRPVPGWAYYRTPIDNLYMCGSATHPGGGIMGAPGRIASQVILKEWKKSAAPRFQTIERRAIPSRRRHAARSPPRRSR